VVPPSAVGVHPSQAFDPAKVRFRSTSFGPRPKGRQRSKINEASGPLAGAPAIIRRAEWSGGGMPCGDVSRWSSGRYGVHGGSFGGPWAKETLSSILSIESGGEAPHPTPRSRRILQCRCTPAQ
jgi:hypothetical protein